MIRMINISVLFHFSIVFFWDSFLWFGFILICQVLPALVCWNLSNTDLQETATLFSDLIKIHLSFFWLNTRVREPIIIDPRSICSGPSFLSAFTNSRLQNLQCEHILHRKSKSFGDYYQSRKVFALVFHTKTCRVSISRRHVRENPHHPLFSFYPFTFFSPKVVQSFLHTHPPHSHTAICLWKWQC